MERLLQTLNTTCKEERKWTEDDFITYPYIKAKVGRGCKGQLKAFNLFDDKQELSNLVCDNCSSIIENLASEDSCYKCSNTCLHIRNRLKLLEQEVESLRRTINSTSSPIIICTYD